MSNSTEKNVFVIWKKNQNFSHNADQQNKIPILESNENHKLFPKEDYSTSNYETLNKISKFMDYQKKLIYGPQVKNLSLWEKMSYNSGLELIKVFLYYKQLKKKIEMPRYVYIKVFNLLWNKKIL